MASTGQNILLIIAICAPWYTIEGYGLPPPQDTITTLFWWPGAIARVLKSPIESMKCQFEGNCKFLLSHSFGSVVHNQIWHYVPQTIHNIVRVQSINTFRNDFETLNK